LPHRKINSSFQRKKYIKKIVEDGNKCLFDAKLQKNLSLIPLFL